MSGASNTWAFGSTQLITLIVAGLATAGVLLSAGFRRRADRRAELWSRLNWSLEQCFRPDGESRLLGEQALQILAESAENPAAPQPPSPLTQYDLSVISLVIYHLGSAIQDEGERDADA